MKNNESKYKQVVNFVIDGIAEGKLQKGDWIPSINEFRENYRLSRDTVFAGLSELKSRGIIASTPGVGYYIASARIPSEQNIFLLFNEFNEFKEDLYNSFMEHVGKGVSVDLYFHNYNRRVFDALVTDANGKYTTYIIMPALGRCSKASRGGCSCSTTSTPNCWADIRPWRKTSKRTPTRRSATGCGISANTNGC